MADTAANEEVYGRPGSSRSPAADPQARLVAIVGVGCRVVLDFVVGTLAQSEQVLTQMLLGNLAPRRALVSTTRARSRALCICYPQSFIRSESGHPMGT